MVEVNKNKVAKSSFGNKKKSREKFDSKVNVHIKTTFNNIIISLANSNGDVLVSSSAGRKGFKGARKNTPLAAKMAAQDCYNIAHSRGVKEVDIFVNGPGAGREAAIREAEACGLYVNSIVDNTSVPYNGCRPPKRRRL